MKDEIKPTSWVKCDGAWIDLENENVEFLNIEEDVWGDDLITFSYLGKIYKSHCIISHNPLINS